MAIAEEQRSSRCWKNSHGEQVDGLSELPESVICHILSLLSTQDSVATSILGRRWRYLWAYVPTLDFDCKNQEIIYRVMLQHRVQTLTTFRLHYETRCSCFQLETWINFATLRNVQKLDLCFRDEDGSIQSDLLPRCLFTCKTLVDLRLDSCGVIPISRSRRGAATVCLPRLKKLHLIFVGYEADESLPHLLFGCPVLEELEIRLGWDMVSCNVSSPTMKRLMFNFINPRGGRAQRLEINTPALEYLKIDDFFYDHINIKCGVLTSLVEAQIILDSDPMVLDFRSLLYIVDKLCNLKYLKLDLSCCLKIVGSAPSPWTTIFRNLTKLKLRADCRFLSMFLKNAANLETLIFDKHCLRAI